MRGSRTDRPQWRPVWVVALLGWLALLAVTAYYPFHWDPPRQVRNEVTRGADGSLHFGGVNRARTPTSPTWLAAAHSTGTISIHLEVRPARSPATSASMFMLASDYWHTDVALAQQGQDLLVSLRRPGSTPSGDPPYTVGGVLPPGRWTSVDLQVGPRLLSISVDGQVRQKAALPGEALATWGPGRVVLGDEVDSGNGWVGQMRSARVRTASQQVDYVRPGALTIPATFFYLPDHIAPFPPVEPAEWVVLALHLASFVPVGAALVRLRRPSLPVTAAVLTATLAALILAAGKFLFQGRHMADADIVCQAMGALIGAKIAKLGGRIGAREVD